MEGRLFGDAATLGKGRSGSSRRAKKSSSDKPKQPQRGLGVAQLEKIRISSERGCSSYIPSSHNPPSMLQEGDARMGMGFSSSGPAGSFVLSSSFGYQPNIMMGFGDMNSREIQQGSSISLASSRQRWSSSNILRPPTSMHSNSTRPFLHSLPSEDLVEENRRRDSVESSIQNSDAQEIDLDLKLSL